MMSVALAAIVGLIVVVLVLLPVAALARLLCLMSLPHDGPALRTRRPFTALRPASRTTTDGRACA